MTNPTDTASIAITKPDSVPPDEKFPAGTDETDRVCWVCDGQTVYRNCKIICKNCGFTRDCSDP